MADEVSVEGAVQALLLVALMVLGAFVSFLGHRYRKALCYVLGLFAGGLMSTWFAAMYIGKNDRFSLFSYTRVA